MPTRLLLAVLQLAARGGTLVSNDSVADRSALACSSSVWQGGSQPAAPRLDSSVCPSIHLVYGQPLGPAFRPPPAVVPMEYSKELGATAGSSDSATRQIQAQEAEMERSELAHLCPEEIRRLIREGRWDSATVGLAPGYVQANLVIVPKAAAYDFLLFCQRNPKPCPLLEVTEAGSPHLVRLAAGADLRTDLPRYRIFRRGQLEDEVTDIKGHWRSDLTAFLLGCSLTFEAALLATGIPVRHLEQKRNVPIYITNIECLAAGAFRGPLVVSMRPIPHQLVVRAVQVTSRYPGAHGAPVHIGDPSVIGITDLSQTDFGEPVTIRSGEVPVFWACGVTPQAVAMCARPELMLTHAPGHMFVTDLRSDELSVTY